MYSIHRSIPPEAIIEGDKDTARDELVAKPTRSWSLDKLCNWRKRQKKNRKHLITITGLQLSTGVVSKQLTVINMN